ncbi:class F sortase [Streptomyces yaizuensis]|uniref:Class F sortase n=1 Tax=Streptomyces yaizuensis TaxID=2989713 RepID=A0ABQ5P3L6_9ACTN|nr:class F sortase [Streptomyces sp. YSPA8]GLF97043.1 class F sortase [Streptomyces sp. YSPA8]
MEHPLARRGAGFCLLSVALLGVFLLRPGPGGPPAPQPRAAGPGAAAAEAVRAPVAGPLPRSAPRRLTVPALGLDTALTPVGLGADGLITPPPPAAAGPAGWYTGAAAPGERGTAVVVGHVDGPAGPAVFYPLGALERNSRIEVARADGSTAVFSVYDVAVHPRRGFPAERVYRDGPGPELRLITCGGRYAPGAGYDSNVVVSARLVATER